MMDEIFGVKIKSYDWMPKDEVALVKPGLAYQIDNKQTGETTEVLVKEPQIIRLKLSTPPLKTPKTKTGGK